MSKGVSRRVSGCLLCDPKSFLWLGSQWAESLRWVNGESVCAFSFNTNADNGVLCDVSASQWKSDYHLLSLGSNAAREKRQLGTTGVFLRGRIADKATSETAHAQSAFDEVCLRKHLKHKLNFPPQFSRKALQNKAWVFFLSLFGTRFSSLLKELFLQPFLGFTRYHLMLPCIPSKMRSGIFMADCGLCCFLVRHLQHSWL